MVIGPWCYPRIWIEGNVRHPEIKMRSTTVVHMLNVISIMTAVPLLCLTFQIFDFIVTHRMYFTIPDQRVLLDPDLFWWFITGIVLTFGLSITAITCELLPTSLQQLCLRYPISFSLGHGALLSTASIFCAYCSYLSTLAANGIERYIYHATPEQFRLASNWYYWKLMYCSVLFGVEALMSLGVLCTLYLGIQCRYRSLAQFPLPTQKSSTTQMFV